jgi:hypothetical protein
LPFKTFRRFGNLGNRLFLYARLGLLSVVEVSAFPSSEVSKNFHPYEIAVFAFDSELFCVLDSTGA